MRIRLLPLLVVAAALAYSPARAQNNNTAPAGDKRVCKDDAKALCQGIKPGQGRIMNCLLGKADQVKNADCKDHLGKIKARQEVVRHACQSDIEANCKGMDFGSGLRRCLRKNGKSLSEACKAVFKKGKPAKGDGDMD